MGVGVVCSFVRFSFVCSFVCVSVCGIADLVVAECEHDIMLIRHSLLMRGQKEMAKPEHSGPKTMAQLVPTRPTRHGTAYDVGPKNHLQKRWHSSQK